MLVCYYLLSKIRPFDFFPTHIVARKHIVVQLLQAEVLEEINTAHTKGKKKCLALTPIKLFKKGQLSSKQ